MMDDAIYERLTTGWPGPHGGMPPLDMARPDLLEAAFIRAIEEKRIAVQAIARNPDAPTFANTIAAMETCGTCLERVDAVFKVFLQSASCEQIAEMAPRLGSMQAQLEDEIHHDATLFQRIEAVYKDLPHSAPDQQGRRLTEVIHARMLRAGAALGTEDKQKLAGINAQLANLRTRFVRNIQHDEENLCVFVTDAAQMAGLPDEYCACARETASERAQAGSHAIPIKRQYVWPVLTHAEDRDLREKVWRIWTGRGANDGAFDNRPIMTEILQLRGEKARLLGYPSFAHFQTADRMARTPEAACQVLQRTWQAVFARTQDDLARMQAIARAEGQDDKLEPWDSLFYAAQYHQIAHDLDTQDLIPYLEIGNVVDGMFWAAEATYGYSFHPLQDVPVLAPEITVHEVQKDGQPMGILVLDLYERTGKGPSSWTSEIRAARSGNDPVLPIVGLYSSVSRRRDDEPCLVPWERANVIFHEFGHALHMLSNRAKYASLGPLHVPWDAIELPALFQERWLQDARVMARVFVHHETGEPMPGEMQNRLRNWLHQERGVTTTLPYLAAAMVDMRLHMLADGRALDAMEVEAEILKELGLPHSVDPTLHVQHAYHTFSQQYAAGLYAYLWSDMLAADINSTFMAAAQGLLDHTPAQRYRDCLLAMGNIQPMETAFRNFQSRDPDPEALLSQFNLL